MTQNLHSISVWKQALRVNKKPFPWLKAFCAGLAAALPVLIGLLCGNFQYGLIAGMGGFTYLYVFPMPYAQLAKKLACVVLALTLCVALGTLIAPYPLLIAITMALIGGIAVFLFGALKYVGPSAIFFVLVFAMTTGMQEEPDQVFIRCGLAFLGGTFSWCLAMSGVFFKKYALEKNSMNRVFIELAQLIECVGTDRFETKKYDAMVVLVEAEKTLEAANRTKNSESKVNYLLSLNEFANKIYIYIVENFSHAAQPLPREYYEAMQKVADGIKFLPEEQPINTFLHPDEMKEKTAQWFMEITNVKDNLFDTNAVVQNQSNVVKPSVKEVLLGAFDKNSIVFINAIRFTLITLFAAVIAYEFGFTRSYWVPLSCVAVMSGATVVATFHRAIQRGIGTVLGILIASLILSLNPEGYIIVFFIFLLTIITELFIVKNYGLAALFFTPSALLMAASVTPGDYTFSYFATARLIDILIGSAIGLFGVWLFGRKSASSRLQHLVSKTIRSQAQVLFKLFTINNVHPKVLAKMQTNVNNLKMMYETALGEIPKKEEELSYYWPILFAIEQLAFLLTKNTTDVTTAIDKETMATYLYHFEMMATNDRERITQLNELPVFDGSQSIQDAINELQKSF